MKRLLSCSFFVCLLNVDRVGNNSSLTRFTDKSRLFAAMAPESLNVKYPDIKIDAKSWVIVLTIFAKCQDVYAIKSCLCDL